MADNNKISKEVINKIHKEVIGKNLLRDLKPIKKQGKSYSETNYRIGTSPVKEFANNIFIVSKMISFRNGSIEENKYNIYAFDLKGNKVKIDMKDYPTDFVKTLIDV